MLNTRDHGQDIEIITDLSLKYALLEKIKHSGALLTITTPDLKKQYASSIIAIDDKNNIIHLDGAQPEAGNNKIIPKTIIVETNLSGVRIKFSTDVLRIITSKEYTSWLANMPRQIEHYQKRSAHRVWIGIGFNIRLSVNTDEHQIFARRVTDLSIDGVGFVIDQTAVPILQSEQEYDCIIESSDNVLFETTIIIRHIESLQKFAKFGARFQNLEEGDRNRLFKLLLDIERDNIRRKTR